MRKKMIGYAIIGLIVLIGISLGFFVQLRKIFKERKILWIDVVYHTIMS